MSRRLHWTVLGIAFAVGVAIGIAISVAHSPTTVADTQTPAIANPVLDRGTHLNAPAPDFTLTDQFGKRFSLRWFVGHITSGIPRSRSSESRSPTIAS